MVPGSRYTPDSGSPVSISSQLHHPTLKYSDHHQLHSRGYDTIANRYSDTPLHHKAYNSASSEQYQSNISTGATGLTVTTAQVSVPKTSYPGPVGCSHHQYYEGYSSATTQPTNATHDDLEFVGLHHQHHHQTATAAVMAQGQQGSSLGPTPTAHHSFYPYLPQPSPYYVTPR
ncbi:hypothetical protein QAD02_015029 [Eretmocerus hayati]|uniref:Uncharacterized protein n=1 Tax=Eretmocerus hayati TaxID=131215 RepID=A0ACC2P9X5_9HYME|nr:hypothetical protein QAD02_015029 [Eretmocerus hayati]